MKWLYETVYLNIKSDGKNKKFYFTGPINLIRFLVSIIYYIKFCNIYSF